MRDEHEHGMKSAKHVVTPALARNDDDEDEEEASTEEHRILRRIVARVCSWLHVGQTLHSPRTGWRGSWKNLQKQTSLRRKVSCDICVVR